MSFPAAYKPVPLGESDFPTVIREGYRYVDKTGLISDFLDDESRVLLLTRPRRFGKTINMSMLEAFFVGELDNQSTADLFTGLSINEQKEFIQSHQGKYPVIFLTFKDLKANSYEMFLNMFANIIYNQYKRHRYLLKSGILESDEEEIFNSFLSRSSSESDLHCSVEWLLDYLKRATGQKVIVLIDEYDTPIHHVIGESPSYLNPIMGFLRIFFGNSLKDSKYLRKGLLTGILRVAKEKMFSGLNNFDVYTVLSEEYGQYFGFTEAEVLDLLIDRGIESSAEEVKSWYNGYNIGGYTVYNPWSILNYLKKQKFEPYWLNTSKNEVMQQEITYVGQHMKEDVAILLAGGSIEKQINEAFAIDALSGKQGYVWSLILMSGYVTAKELRYDYGDKVCKLTIPNREVGYLYRHTIQKWLCGAGESPSEFANSLLSGNLELFERELDKVIQRMVSSHDVGLNTQEAFYHALILGSLAFVDNRNYKVNSNIESGAGRPDVIIEPYDINQYGVVLEFKYCQDSDKLETRAHKAIEQIKVKNYTAQLAEAGVKQIILVGIAFRGKQFNLAHETIELK